MTRPDTVAYHASILGAGKPFGRLPISAAVSSAEEVFEAVAKLSNLRSGSVYSLNEWGVRQLIGYPEPRAITFRQKGDVYWLKPKGTATLDIRSAKLDPSSTFNALIVLEGCDSEPADSVIRVPLRCETPEPEVQHEGPIPAGPVHAVRDGRMDGLVLPRGEVDGAWTVEGFVRVIEPEEWIAYWLCSSAARVAIAEGHPPTS